MNDFKVAPSWVLLAFLTGAMTGHIFLNLLGWNQGVNARPILPPAEQLQKVLP